MILTVALLGARIFSRYQSKVPDCKNSRGGEDDHRPSVTSTTVHGGAKFLSSAPTVKTRSQGRLFQSPNRGWGHRRYQFRHSSRHPGLP